MKVKGLDGQAYNMKLAGRSPLESDISGRSKYHVRARLLLKKLFPLEQRLEEVPLPGSGGLTADFFLPNRRLLVETHGQQHYEPVGFFQKTPLDFFHGQKRDRRKAQWADLNNITYVELPFDESDDEWVDRIQGGTGGPGTG